MDTLPHRVDILKPYSRYGPVSVELRSFNYTLSHEWRIYNLQHCKNHMCTAQLASYKEFKLSNV
ncbi:hypothetical protein PR048_007360 [Dryococelus australis]|uniref:Uncharacterized protein n=1 Tax=Dryococelus australis TaxID=614101 RepID=A0ABQ9HU12_9NEOP|nr:hypothetical protein PR048_007360 [Dryococelus australis]